MIQPLHPWRVGKSGSDDLRRGLTILIHSSACQPSTLPIEEDQAP